MEQQIIIPEHVVLQETKSKKINFFLFDVDSQQVSINFTDYTNTDSSDPLLNAPRTVILNFVNIANEMTESQRTIIKGFFKRLGAYALDVSTADISGDII